MSSERRGTERGRGEETKNGKMEGREGSGKEMREERRWVGEVGKGKWERRKGRGKEREKERGKEGEEEREF